MLRKAGATLRSLRGRGTRPDPATDDPAFREVLDRARRPTDISDHLPTLYVEAHRAAPRTIVELGVRTGESTFVFERVARAHGATLVSVDVDDCSDACGLEGWAFVREDDVAFGRRFQAWCAGRGIEPAVDVLLVDTTHVLAHTADEIDAWFPHLSPDAVCLFHDTNLSPVYRRLDGSRGRGFDNERGVIRALEERLGVPLDETRRFSTVAGGFVVEHHPWCAGLTILTRVPR